MTRRTIDSKPRKEIKPKPMSHEERLKMREAYLAHRAKNGLPIPKMRFQGRPKTATQ